MIVAILIGRKGSKGLPDKNVYPILGRPSAYYPMMAAKGCKQIDRLYISTDDELLMELGVKCGAEIIQRPQELCTDQALGEHVFVHAYNHVKAAAGGVEIAVLLMCNAVTVSPKILSEGITALRENPELDSAVTVSRYNMWSPLRARKVGPDGLLHPFVPFELFGDPAKLNCDRDSQGDVWFADMGASIVRGRCLERLDEGLLPQKWMGRKIYPLRQWGGLDVDFEWQIPQAEFWLRKNWSGL
ncbi:MAG TPA: cytidylyltransferase [Deltaproteobacteria bacterium]|nr:MAG: cytidylyltransferase [Deltaproteobacteria bacterium GWA2_55_82]OGQ63465.1 MAG: cytidylyltransferase [Deltaproteobacteria bacterium RIFCSPLOWO2_02_FULL_55_12]OIJ74846.1 MAG: cytidylyltransferase [Deltaproteobacteria bacterium GWC2_55_46]HBG47506.1 cytidylyltransferase [Deltaproteobacteria bacterium]HCY11522.1 cytidylyltransferase [Deltaproteobacteria bacterium]